MFAVGEEVMSKRRASKIARDSGPAPDNLTCIRRTAKVTAALMRGEGLTVTQVMIMTGLTRQGAHYLLNALVSVIGIYDDPETGMWQLNAMKELL